MVNGFKALILSIGLFLSFYTCSNFSYAESTGAENSDFLEMKNQLKIIDAEMTSDNPDIFAIESALIVMRARANNEFVDSVVGLRALLRQKKLAISSSERKGELYNEFDKTLAAIQTRAEIISADQAKFDESKISAHTPPQYFRDYLTKTKDDPRTKRGPQIHEKIPTIPEEYLLLVMSGILTDDVRLNQFAGHKSPLIGRDAEAQKVMDVLVRSKAKNPVLVGGAGVGKTQVAKIVAENIINKKFPLTDVYLAELENAEIIVTTPARISQLALSNEPTAQAAAMEHLFDAVRAVEQNYEKKTGVKKHIIVFIDDLHTLDPPQINALKQAIEDDQHPIRVIGASLNEALELKLKQASGIKKLIEIIPIQELSVEITLNLLNEIWVPKFKETYNVEFSEKALRVIVEVSSYLRPGLARPESPFMVMQEVAVKAHRDSDGQFFEVSDDYIYEYTRQVTGIPTNPHKSEEFDKYLQNLRTTLSKRVINQNRMIDAVVDLWSQVLTGNPKVPKSILLSGPTGAGKSLLAENFATEAFGDKGRIFKLDGTLLQDGKFALGSVFGVPNGVQGADQTSGTFMEWLDDPSRGKMGGVIVVNEAEKMHPDAWRRLMEFMSEGVVSGGDGKPRYANRHLVIFTTNKGTREIFPDSVKSWSQAEIDTRISQLSESDIKNYFLRPDLGREEFVLPREIMGRINKAVVANPVTAQTAVEIGKIEVANYVAKLYELYHIKVALDPRLIQHLSITGLDSLEGARPIHNQVETYINEAMKEARKHWSIARDESIELKLVEFAPGINPEIEVSFKSNKFNIKAPKTIVNNPLADKEVRNMIDKLSEIMHGHMVEQPESVNEIVTAIKAKLGDAGRKRPISITLVGTTGVGKTEMGRAMALAVYGSTERAALIGLGEAHSNRALDIIFGVGSDSISPFEKILMDNPQGGVIMLDEFSNMGGNDLDTKNAMIKRFYTMIEEGFWQSLRAEGRVYDLKKYTFLFTGNDLEAELQGVSSDEQRFAIWQKIKNREQVQALLIANGVPEAFLGRQDVVAVLRPLVGTAKARVSDKLLEEWQKRFEFQHQGVKVEWDQEFLDQLARSYFSHDRGARSVRAVIENHITALATETLLKNNYDSESIQGLVIKLRLKDNLPKDFIAEGKTEARKVILFTELFKNNELILTHEIDATEASAKAIVISKDEALLTAYREVGQFITHNDEVTQSELVYITVRGSMVKGERILGYSRYEDTAGANKSVTRKKVVALLAALWGGRLAQEKAGLEPDFMWEKNLSQMRHLATEHISRFGLDDGLEAVRINEEGEPQLSSTQKEQYDKELKKLFVEAKAQAIQQLDSRWSEVQRLVSLLVEKGELSAADIKSSGFLLSGNCASLLSPEPK